MGAGRETIGHPLVRRGLRRTPSFYAYPLYPATRNHSSHSGARPVT